MQNLMIMNKEQVYLDLIKTMFSQMDDRALFNVESYLIEQLGEVQYFKIQKDLTERQKEALDLEIETREELLRMIFELA
jgi:hypothetical protein